MSTAEQNILFSIIMPTYNRAQLIGIAIESVLNQSYDHWELIVVDDGSGDDTRQVVDFYMLNDSRIKYFCQKNQGESVARNLGISHARGDYVCFLDDDDYYYEDFLSSFDKLISGQKGLTQIYMCDQAEESGHEIKTRSINQRLFSENSLAYLIRYGNNIQPFVFPAKILKEEFFDPRFVFGEDVHLLLRILLKLPLCYLNKTLCVYKNHRDMTFGREFKDGLFLKTGYTRLDMFDDLFLKYKNEFLERKALPNLCFQYNKYCYFYAGSALKSQKPVVGLSVLKKMKWEFPNFILFYYSLSILIRLPYYSFKKLMRA